MRNGSTVAVKNFMWFVSAFHVVVGLSLMFSPTLTKMIAAGYGASVNWTDQFLYILKPMGAFMLILGVAAAAAAREPLRYPAVIYGFVALFAIRALQRVLYLSDIERAFAIPGPRLTFNTVAMLALSASLFVLYRTTRRQTVE